MIIRLWSGVYSPFVLHRCAVRTPNSPLLLSRFRSKKTREIVFLEGLALFLNHSLR